MKQLFATVTMVCTLLVLLTAGARAEESRRGLYEGDLAGGGKVVFFAQGNHSISVYVFDKSAQTAEYAGGALAANGHFSLTTNANRSLSGNLTKESVSASLAGTGVTATRVSIFGISDDVAGRFTATAQNGTTALEVKFLVDSQGRIFFIGKNGINVIGGFGTVSIQHASHGADDPPGDDHGNHDEDEDEAEDHHEDEDDAAFNATFTLTLVTGEAVTGHLFFSHDLLVGDLTLNGDTFTFRAPRESAGNHFINISTRAFVSTGQGQLISGFIVRGGPKLVIIRALGPSLAAGGVSPVLQDPVVQLFSGSKMISQNDDWAKASNSDDLRHSSIPPTNAHEAALIVRLEPGPYTAVVTGANNTTGIALVEVYEADRD